MARLTRGAHMLFLNGGTTEDPKWYLIGKHIDDMSFDMNGTFEDSRNILDEAYVTDEGYVPTVEVTPYFADPGDAIYSKLRDLMEGRLSGEKCFSEYMEVLIEDTTAPYHTAWKDGCYIEIDSYGGDTKGLSIEYTIHPDGNRTEALAQLDENKDPVFGYTDDTAILGQFILGRARLGADTPTIKV